MKINGWIISAVMVVALAVGGCSKGSKVDTAPLEKSFKTAEPATQSSADKVVSEIKAENYSQALTDLQTLAKNAKLTPEQQQAIKDVMAQVQQAITDAAAKATAAGSKAASDLQKSLPK